MKRLLGIKINGYCKLMQKELIAKLLGILCRLL
jgi:hypothetical protein